MRAFQLATALTMTLRVVGFTLLWIWSGTQALGQRDDDELIAKPMTHSSCTGRWGRGSLVRGLSHQSKVRVVRLL